MIPGVGERAIILTASAVKALFMTVMVGIFAASEPFWHQLVIVFVSAAMTVLGMVVSAYISTRRIEPRLQKSEESLGQIKSTQENRQVPLLEEIKKQGNGEGKE